MVTKISKFIEDNKLNFTDSGSSLNSNCVILAGYALFIGIDNVEDLFKAIPYYGSSEMEELERVFDFAMSSSYGDYWNTEDAKKRYKF